MQPAWWDEYEAGSHSPESSPTRELPVSSSVPDSSSTPRSHAASPHQPAANGNVHSHTAAESSKAQPPQSAVSLTDAVRTLAASGQWVSPVQSDRKRPPPRYEHAAAIVGHHLYIIGGNCGELTECDHMWWNHVPMLLVCCTVPYVPLRFNGQQHMYDQALYLKAWVQIAIMPGDKAVAQADKHCNAVHAAQTC